ncbi:MAG TPA: ABC transporter ATPase [Bacteroidia bacterium]|jgi:hypothetical protein|nr:ABC transporter ATPase [Bacteroidia bacterium]
MNTFDQMPLHSRCWIYQSNRDLTDIEVAEIKKKAAMFLIDWNSHGNVMMASIDVLHNRFVVVLADEEAARASGCGIDKSVRFVQQLGEDYHIDFFDRMLVSYRDTAGKIRQVKLQVFEQMMEKKELSGDTIVFNNLVATKEEMMSKWEVPVKKSWHSRMVV